MIYEIKKGAGAEELFESWKEEETIISSCLHQIMGRVFGDREEAPSSAAAMLGDFTFLAGRPDRELAVFQPHGKEWEYRLIIPQNEEWSRLIQDIFPGETRKITRYRLKKEPDVFNRERLEETVRTLPKEYEMQKLDEAWFHRCRNHSWCRDFVSNYQNYEQYQRIGLGIIILRKGEIVAGASSYSSYPGGIEIEIDTREDYRRKGLAYISASALILACLEKGWYPSWDAHNKASLALAEKLGYHLDQEYTAYEKIVLDRH